MSYFDERRDEISDERKYKKRDEISDERRYE
jgi:hypothetical protein